MNKKSKRIISMLLSTVMSLSSIPPVVARSEDNTERYPYTFFAGSSDDGAITINSDNICINGNIATNGTIVSSKDNLNINGTCTENADEPIIQCFNRIDSAYFNTSDVLTYFEDYYLEQTNITVDTPIEAEGSIGLTGNINISSGLKALDDIQLSGNVENSWNSAICSKTGDIIIDTENVNLNGLVYAPQGEVNINAMNLNINNVIIIADTITITCPNLNANYSSYAGGLIGNESETDLRLNANGVYDPETDSINIYWYTTVPQGSFDIQMSDDNDTYYSVGTVENVDSFTYELPEEFEKKYIKVVETTATGESCESFPFIIENAGSEHKIEFIDNDSDGLPDSFELKIETDPDKEDTDEDGLTDYQEIFLTGTDPTVFDSEVPGISDSDADNDKDGINNTDEISYGTNPNKEDTDGDGLSDYDEIFTYHTDPLSADSDNDGVNDGAELKLGLDPDDPATNGVPDAEYSTDQIISADSPLFTDINTENNPYELSIDINTNGYAEEELDVRNSGYSASIANDAITGSCLSISTTDKCAPENIRLQFNIKEDSIDNALGTYADCDELSGIKRFNVFRFYDNVNMLLPVETKFDIENNVVYTDTTEPGTYCIIDMEKWFDELDIEPVNKAPAPKRAPAKPDYEKHSFNGHDYAVIPLCDLSWTEARDYCESIGGHLATITSKEEQQFIMTILHRQTSMLWLGGSKVNGNWEWVTKEKWEYTNWSPIEPSTHTGENYLEMFLRGGLEFSIGQWNNIALHNNENSFYNAKECGILCEWDNETTETPEFFETLIATRWKTIRLNSKLNPYNNTDTDRDSLTDWEEVKTEYLIKNSDGTYDLPTFNQVFTMADIILNLQRFAGTPYQLKLDDLWERKFLPVNSDPTLVDSDEDELDDADEYYGKTDALNSDTDGDKLSDGVEDDLGFDPLNANNDGDSYDDYQELQNNTDPNTYDLNVDEAKKAFIRGLIFGEFETSDNIETLLGQITGAFIPYIDARDYFANVFVKLNTKDALWNVGGFLLDLAPLAGSATDTTKVISKIERFAVKHSDDAPKVIEAISRISRVFPKSEKMIPAIAGALPASTLDSLVDTVKNGDNLTTANYNRIVDICKAAGKNVDEIEQAKKFKTFKALKKHLGSPGKNMQWHHIVEQCQAKKTRSAFDIKEINKVSNVKATPKEVHKEISKYYSSKQDFTGNLTFRDWLNGKSYDEQYEYGIKVWKEKMADAGYSIN